MTCFNCGQSGHFAGACPNPKQPFGQGQGQQQSMGDAPVINLSQPTPNKPVLHLDRANLQEFQGDNYPWSAQMNHFNSDTFGNHGFRGQQKEIINATMMKR